MEVSIFSKITSGQLGTGSSGRGANDGHCRTVAPTGTKKNLESIGKGKVTATVTQGDRESNPVIP